ncbi:MAG TPA: glutamyl-tRNA reductase [Ignavibacteriaceae bacterium]|nr:glutamyl-tRNA reductase [Ignavibacteriaceae bacterium]
MNIIAISINHNTAPVEVREAVYLNNEEIKNLTHSIKNSLFSEGLIVTTCNRTEIYGIPANQNLSHQEIQNALLNFKSVTGLKPEHFQYFSSANAIKHLFSVATGIDSLLIGDNQIFKQVKDSFQAAEDLNFTGFLMKRIFDSTVKAGRRAISETGISEGAVTVSYAAVQLIEKIFSNLSKKSALVIGAGETGEIAAKHLRERGIGNLTITNRTYERAEKLAENLSAKILPFGNFKDSLHEFDIVLSATSSDSLILTKADVHAAMKKRNYNALVLMDIAIPRDIDPETKNIDYVFYNDIDSLNIIVQQNLTKRKEEIPKVEKIIEEELNSFLSWFNSLEVAPTIKNLRDYFEAIRLEEVEKNKNRFSSEDQEKLEIITKRIINKILHHPTVELKKYTESGANSDEAAQKVSIVRELFGMIKDDEKEDQREK